MCLNNLTYSNHSLAMVAIYADVAKWQTRRSQKPLEKSLWVQVPPSVPNAGIVFNWFSISVFQTEGEGSNPFTRSIFSFLRS